MIGCYTKSSEEECWGRVDVIPSMFYKGRAASIGFTNVRMGVIYQVRPESTSLKPYIEQRLNEDGETELVTVDEQPLVVSAELRIVVPLTQSLEEIVKIHNSRTSKEKTKEE
ncbi:hypothetical protein J4447_02745 [Candidatus Pacearchaeota archaeon]|nr:hypothetical protein [Candidatus Pacearchaeota archaeon]